MYMKKEISEDYAFLEKLNSVDRAIFKNLTEEEKLEIATKRIMKQYKPAFEKLAEY